MLGENLKIARKAKKLSQQELATQLNVVRQTVSKWEQGLSVPDSEMLLNIAERLETPVHSLLGETPIAEEKDDMKAISAKLEVISEQLTEKKHAPKKFLHILCGVVLAVVVAFFLFEIGTLIYMKTFPVEANNPNVSIIGGADAPTAILVLRSLNPSGMIRGILLLIAALVGFILTKAKK